MSTPTATSSILGLHWENNYCAETGVKSYTLVANPGPLVSDFHYFGRDEYPEFVLQIGQANRFTFIGDPEQQIVGEFVDCRRGSPSLHQGTTLKFLPDPRKVLHIAQGIAMRFSGLINITVRSEPVLYAPSTDTRYNVGNDQIRIPADAGVDNFPTVSVNDLPLPPQVLQIIMKRQQEILATGGDYDTVFDVALDGNFYRFRAPRRGEKGNTTKEN